MKKYSTLTFLSLFAFLLNGCLFLIVPPSNPTTTKPTPSPQPSPLPTPAPTPTETPSTTEKTNKKTNKNKSVLSDPDNLKINFTKEASESYLNEFRGKVRNQAKTTPSDAATRYYETVADVLKTLPTDGYMRKIGVNDSSPRTEDENINVFIRKAYLFYISKEEDGDFHLIIGDLVKGEKKNLMTAEISGLPADKSSRAYFLLERTRRQLYERFPEFFTSNKKTFIPRSNFSEIAIRGSLFFDTHHSAGQIGGANAKPNTVWEIHPITYLNFITEE